MSSCGSSGEDYAARRLRRIQQDINCGDFMNWATDEEIAARKAELERNVQEEVRRAASRQPGGRAENKGQATPLLWDPLTLNVLILIMFQGQCRSSRTPYCSIAVGSS